MDNFFTQTIKKFNIPKPPKDLLLKPIIKEWYLPIVMRNIEKNPIKPKTSKYDKTEINLYFETEKDLIQYNKEFNLTIHKTINEYIDYLNENPKKYNRIIVLESKVENLSLNFYF